jgi:hypothetical protein
MGKQVILKSLLAKKEQLMHEKNECTSKIFFSFRKGLQKRVKEIDIELSKIGYEMTHLRSSLNFSRPTLIKGFKK